MKFPRATRQKPTSPTHQSLVRSTQKPDVSAFATHVSNGEWTTAHCRRLINQGFIDLFGQQGSVLVPHL